MSLTGAGVTPMLAAVQCSLNEDAPTGPRCLLLPPSPHWPLPGFSDTRMTPLPIVAQHLLGAGRLPRECPPVCGRGNSGRIMSKDVAGRCLTARMPSPNGDSSLGQAASQPAVTTAGLTPQRSSRMAGC